MKNSVIIHIALFALLWRTDGSPAKTIRVSQDGNNDFRSIQMAVNSGSPGDTIKVASGVYDEKVELVDRSGLFLIGGYDPSDWSRDIEKYPTIIDGTLTEAVYCLLLSRASDVTISGFELTGAERMIGVYPARDVIIEKCFIHDADGSNYTSGILIESKSDFKTERITIRNNVIWNIIGPDYRGGGIDVSLHQPLETEDITIINNTIYGVSQDGIIMGRTYGSVLQAAVLNNIVVDARDTGIQFRDIRCGTSDFNCVFNAGKPYSGEFFPFTGGAHDLNEDPLFKDVMERDFSLRPDSPCLGAGGRGSDIGALGVTGFSVPPSPIVHDLIPFSLLEPPNDTTIYTTQPVLKWQQPSTDDVLFPGEIRYKIYCATGPDFSDAEIVEIDGSTSITLFDRAPGEICFWKVLADNGAGQTMWSTEVNVFSISYATGVNRSALAAAPSAFSFFQNFPNPFNATTMIPYTLPRNGHVEIKIFDPLGRVIRTLVDGEQPVGGHQITWDGLDNSGAPVASGVYFCQMTAEGFSVTHKLILVR